MGGGSEGVRANESPGDVGPTGLFARNGRTDELSAVSRDKATRSFGRCGRQQLITVSNACELGLVSTS